MKNDEKRLNACALTIAGSDSGAGAGIQADLKTLAAHGVFGVSVVTMITSQSTSAVDAVYPLPPSWIEQQLATVFADFNITAIKTGALGTAEIITTVAGFLRNMDTPALVIDPVMISKHGHPLLAREATAALVAELLPLAHVVTPNLLEAATLANIGRIVDRVGMITAAEQIAAKGCRAVLVKGGHGPFDATDLLWDDGAVHWFTGDRLATVHTHGTGCTFSAAIAAGLVQGLALPEAVAAAKEYISGAIAHGQVFGRGINPVNHFWQTQPRFGMSDH